MFTKRPANLNTRVHDTTDQELDQMVGFFADKDVDKTVLWRGQLYEDLMDRTYRLASKQVRKVKLPMELLFAAAATVALDVAITYTLGLQRRNAAAGESLKRALQKRMREW